MVGAYTHRWLLHTPPRMRRLLSRWACSRDRGRTSEMVGDGGRWQRERESGARERERGHEATDLAQGDIIMLVSSKVCAELHSLSIHSSFLSAPFCQNGLALSVTKAFSSRAFDRPIVIGRTRSVRPTNRPVLEFRGSNRTSGRSRVSPLTARSHPVRTVGGPHPARERAGGVGVS